MGCGGDTGGGAGISMGSLGCRGALGGIGVSVGHMEGMWGGHIGGSMGL